MYHTLTDFQCDSRLLICLIELDGHSDILFDWVIRVLTGCRSCLADRQRRMKMSEEEEETCPGTKGLSKVVASALG